MKPFIPTKRTDTRGQAAFTMVEIAFALAVIGIALVSIIGVLPLGMDVQKNNRRETIINQDANYFADAIRNGARGLDDLTNYVTTVTNYWTRYDAAGSVLSRGEDSYTTASYALLPSAPEFRVTSVSPNITDYRLFSGERIIGVLSTPKYLGLGGGRYQSNYVVAYVQAISGAAMEKYPQDNEAVRESAFSYRMVVELTPFRAALSDSGASGGVTNGFFHPAWTNYLLSVSPGEQAAVVNAVNNWANGLETGTNANPDPVFYLTNWGVSVNPAGVDVEGFRAAANQWLVSRQTTPNLYDLRLLFRWPVQPGGRIGNGRQAYRAMVSGSVTNIGAPLYFVQPETFVRIP